MTSWRVPQFEPFLNHKEAEEVAACVRSGWITEGPVCEVFIERIKELTGVKYGVLAPNGTLALYLALEASGGCRGSEVIVPDLTFAATATAVIMAGGTPVFADVNEYGQLDWSAVQHVWGWETLGVIPVHLYGAACATEDLAPKGAVVIEDACQALGVSFNGKSCGSMGKASAFSFFADKTITTGEGGFVGTNDATIYERLRYLRNQGRIDRGSFVHPKIGQNFRMTDLQASLGLAQLEKFDDIVSRKRAIYAAYWERLHALEGIERVLEPPPGSTHIPFRTVVFFRRTAAEAAGFLRARGVEPRSAFYPMHKQPCFLTLPVGRRHDDDLFPNSNHFWAHALCLPTFPGLTEEQHDIVCGAIEDFCKGENP